MKLKIPTNKYFIIAAGAATAVTLLCSLRAIIEDGSSIFTYHRFIFLAYIILYFSTAAVFLWVFGTLHLYGTSYDIGTPRKNFRAKGTSVLGGIFLLTIIKHGLLNYDGKTVDSVCKSIAAGWIGFLLGTLVVFLIGYAFQDKPVSTENSEEASA